MSEKRIFWLTMINLTVALMASIYSIWANDWEILKVNIPSLGTFKLRYNTYGFTVHIACLVGFLLLMGKMLTINSTSNIDNILDNND